jgi:hypothetical protein
VKSLRALHREPLHKGLLCSSALWVVPRTFSAFYGRCYGTYRETLVTTTIGNGQKLQQSNIVEKPKCAVAQKQNDQFPDCDEEGELSSQSHLLRRYVFERIATRFLASGRLVPVIELAAAVGRGSACERKACIWRILPPFSAVARRRIGCSEEVVLQNARATAFRCLGCHVSM